ncbi:MAG: FtsX-like permease family protein [Promethearchaeota archaeon]
MFRYVLFAVCVLVFLYLIVKNVLHTLNQRKKVKRAQKAVKIHPSRNKSYLVGFWYRYARHYLLIHRKRAVILLFGFVVASTIVTSTFLWVDIAPHVVVQKGLETQAFPLVIRPEAPFNNLVLSAGNSIRQNSLVEATEVVRRTVGLYGVEDKPNNFYWPNASYVSESNELFIISNDYLSYVSNKFLVNGSFQVSKEEVVISQRLAMKLESRMNRKIEVDSYINVSIAQRMIIPDLNEFQLIYWNPIHLLNLRVAGIFVRKPPDPLISNEYSEDTLGDAIFISEEVLTDEVLQEITSNGNIFTTQVFVRLDRRELANQGLTNVKETIRSLKAQTEEEFGWRVFIQTHTENLYREIDTYLNSRLLVNFLLMPSFFAAFLFILFSTQVLYYDRKEEIHLLTSKGASLFQILIGLTMESIILAIEGSIIGVLLSIGNMFFMAGTRSFMDINFDWSYGWEVLILMGFKPWLWIIPLALCSTVLIISVSYQLNKYLKIEDNIENMQPTRFQKWFTNNYLDVASLIWIYIILVAATLIGILDIVLADPTWLATVLVLILGIWLGLSLISTKVQTTLGRPATNLLKPLLKNRSIFIQRNFLGRHSQIFALGAILVLASSICFFTLGYQSTVQNYTSTEVNFALGADLRLQTDAIDPVVLTDQLSIISEIERITPVHSTWGQIGNREISIYGFIPEIFSEISKSKIANLDLRQQWVDALNRLQVQGVIINSLMAQRDNLKIGDALLLEIRQNELIELEIAGIFSAAPGFGKLSADPSSYTGDNYGTVFVSSRLSIFNEIPATMGFCKLKSDTDLDKLIMQLYKQVPEISSIQTKYFDIRNVGFLSLTGTSGILTFNFLLSIAIFFLALLLFFAHIVDQRRAEYAIMRVCGAKTHDLYRLISSEGFLIIGLSFLIAAILGLTFAWILSRISLRYLPFNNILPLTFYFPLDLLAPFILFLGIAFLIGTIYPSRRVIGQNITNIIKNL